MALPFRICWHKSKFPKIAEVLHTYFHANQDYQAHHCHHVNVVEGNLCDQLHLLPGRILWAQFLRCFDWHDGIFPTSFLSWLWQHGEWWCNVCWKVWKFWKDFFPWWAGVFVITFPIWIWILRYLGNLLHLDMTIRTSLIPIWAQHES